MNCWRRTCQSLLYSQELSSRWSRSQLNILYPPCELLSPVFQDILDKEGEEKTKGVRRGHRRLRECRLKAPLAGAAILALPELFLKTGGQVGGNFSEEEAEAGRQAGRRNGGLIWKFPHPSL